MAPLGCGETLTVEPAPPAWAADANPPSDVPILLAREGNIAAFAFGAPLHVPPSSAGRTNKVLWVVREPRDSQPLAVAGHPIDAATPTVAYTFPGNGGPGEIYSTIIDVPSPGCWQFTLSWGPNVAHIDLTYFAGTP